jgi:predicted HAD superfamily Cof-like phosphohydrolase
MRKTMFEMVRDFHEAFGQRVGTKPTLPNYGERELRIRLMGEEFKEYNQAEENDDLTNLAVELADIIYIACGTAVSYGIPLDEVFEAIHNANMEKLVDGKVIRREDGKIKKPEGWKPADIAGILNKHSE